MIKFIFNYVYVLFVFACLYTCTQASTIQQKGVVVVFYDLPTLYDFDHDTSTGCVWRWKIGNNFLQSRIFRETVSKSCKGVAALPCSKDHIRYLSPTPHNIYPNAEWIPMEQAFPNFLLMKMKGPFIKTSGSYYASKKGTLYAIVRWDTSTTGLRSGCLFVWENTVVSYKSCKKGMHVKYIEKSCDIRIEWVFDFHNKVDMTMGNGYATSFQTAAWFDPFVIYHKKYTNNIGDIIYRSKHQTKLTNVVLNATSIGNHSNMSITSVPFTASKIYSVYEN